MVPSVAVQPGVSVLAFAVLIAVSGETPEWVGSPWNIGQSTGSPLVRGRSGPWVRGPWWLAPGALAVAAGPAVTGCETASAAPVTAIALTRAAAVTAVINAGLDRVHLDIRTLSGSVAPPCPPRRAAVGEGNCYDARQGTWFYEPSWMLAVMPPRGVMCWWPVMRTMAW